MPRASKGYYLMHRGWMENPVFAGESFSRAQAWCWLVEHAAWKTLKIDVLGHTVTLCRGQLCYSTRYLATAWRWSEAKVRRFTTRLKTDAMIDAATDAGQTLITIRNYDKYQATPDTSDAPSGAPFDPKATQERRRSDANKNEREEREEGNKALSNERAYTVDAVDLFDQFWSAFPSRRPHSNPKKPARQKFEAAVKRGVDPLEIVAGAKLYAQHVARHIPNPQHIAQAQTWLNQERWTEHHEEPDHDENPAGQQVGRNHHRCSKRSSASDKWIAGARSNLARGHSEKG